jgi:hypothetical protein
MIAFTLHDGPLGAPGVSDVRDLEGFAARHTFQSVVTGNAGDLALFGVEGSSNGEEWFALFGGSGSPLPSTTPIQAVQTVNQHLARFLRFRVHGGGVGSPHVKVTVVSDVEC